MPSWKKVIVSGSDASLTSVTATAGFTGSLLGTASFATSASYAQTASYSQNLQISGSINNVDYIDFTLLSAEPAFNTGRLHWTDDSKTLQLDTDVNNFELEIGHQSVIRGRNVNSFTLTKGSVVYINGESGNRPTFATASWEGDPSSATTIGIIAQDINSSQTGYAVTNGLIRDVNTNAFPPGTSLYLSSSGQYTDVPPLSPLHEVRLGKTITQSTSGILYIDIQNGYEIGELHDVLITSASTGDLLVWDSGSQVWENTKQLTGSYGLTGSLTATSFTGSLLGTASFATTASYTLNAVSSSFASTASFTPNALTTASVSSNTITFTKGDGTTFPITVNTGSSTSAFPFTGSADITGSLTVNGSFIATGSNGTINTDTSNLLSSDILSVDWGDRRLYDSTGLQTSLNWRIRNLFDTNESSSLDWNTRQLNNAASTPTVDWNNNILYDSNAVDSVDWDNRNLFDSNLKKSTDWRIRNLFDSNESSSLDWQARQLNNDSGNTVLTWLNGIEITKSTVITGSLRGNVSALSIASNTASLDMSTNNFFTLNLVNGADTHINPTNINPGQTVNIRVNQDSAGTGTVSFPSTVDQPSGSAYTGSQVANAIDIVTMITFDSSLVFVSSVRNMI